MIIDTLQIKYFLEVAKYLNFTKAANELYVSQPAISRKVAALEKELGITLIDRSNRELRLTEEGKEFQKFFSTYLYQLEKLTIDIKKRKNIPRGEIHIGIFEGWDLSNFLRILLEDFKIKHEGIEIIIDTGREDYLIKGLKSEKFNAILILKVAIEQAIKEGYVNDVVLYDFVRVKKNVLYSTYNSLYGKQDIKLTDFKDQTLYTFTNRLIPVELTSSKALFEKYGFIPKVKILSSLDAVINAVSTGSGYAILDNLMRVIGSNGFEYFELDEYHTISIVTLKESKNEINSIFLDYCKGKYI